MYQQTVCDKLYLDKTLDYGQVRTVDANWVEKLEETFRQNRPDDLELTVWKEQGVYNLVLSRHCFGAWFNGDILFLRNYAFRFLCCSISA